MISPHTPPGTKVVCIKAVQCVFSTIWITPAFPLEVGGVYTVAEIKPFIYDADGFAVYLAETDGFISFGLTIFRRLDLPEWLTDLLQSKPVDVVDNEPWALPHSVPASNLPAACVPADASASADALVSKEDWEIT